MVNGEWAMGKRETTNVKPEHLTSRLSRLADRKCDEK
jgi:hypothetical protein